MHGDTTTTETKTTKLTCQDSLQEMYAPPATDAHSYRRARSMRQAEKRSDGDGVSLADPWYLEGWSWTFSTWVLRGVVASDARD